MAASLDLPLRDAWFDAADRALGLDWQALLGWMVAHASLHPMFSVIYSSLMPQTVVVVLALAMAGRLAWLRVFVLAFIISTIVTIVIAALVPAEGVWGFHKLSAVSYPDIVPATQEIHLPVFRGIRDGSFRQLMAMGAQGIITFPSLHAALALIVTVALWPIPVLRWLGLAINTLMLVSIPVDGGHYFIDVLAGLAIAWASLLAAKRIAEFAHQPQLQTANSGSWVHSWLLGFRHGAFFNPSTEMRVHAAEYNSSIHPCGRLRVRCCSAANDLTFSLYAEGFLAL